MGKIIMSRGCRGESSSSSSSALLTVAISSMMVLTIGCVAVMNDEEIFDEPSSYRSLEVQHRDASSAELDFSKLDEEGSGADEEEGEPATRTLLLVKLLKQKFHRLQALHRVTTLPPFVGCICVPFYLCNSNGTIISDGSGVIDLRQRQCASIEVCCYLRAPTPRPTLPPPPPPTTTLPPTPPPTRPPQPTIPPTVPTNPCCNPCQQIFINPCYGSFLCCASIPQPITTVPPPPPITFTIPTTLFTIPTTVPTTTSLPPIYVPSCVCMLLVACNLGYISANNLGSVDPRMIFGRQSGGSCGVPNSVCCQLVQNNVNGPVITLPAAAASSSSSANYVASPTVNAPAILAPASTDLAAQFSVIPDVDIILNPGTVNACVCVATDQCPDGEAVTNNGLSAIDPRFGPCKSAVLVCCKLENRRQRIDVVSQPTIVNGMTCGARDKTYASDANQVDSTLTYFGEFPWMALLLTRKLGEQDVFQCGGSIINERTILTAAHCVVSVDPETLVIRAGEWDTRSLNEPLPFQESNAKKIIVHSDYVASGLYHDVALVTLVKPLTYAVNVRPVCLPIQGQVFPAGTICYASGWGRDAFGSVGELQTTLRKVDLPIVDDASCQKKLKATRLGPLFKLHSSFLCAGGQISKDTCQKDGGGPLVCSDESGSFTQAGVVSWGIGCGSNTPAVYASVAQHRQWIEQQLMLTGIYS